MKTTFAAVLTLAMALPGVAQQVPDYVPTDGLMGWWSLTGTLEDQSSHGHNAQNFGAVFTSDRHGVEGAALHFDGESWMESPVPQTEAWSVSIWASQEDAAAYNGLIQHKNNCVRGAGWLVSLPGNNAVRLARQNCGECSPSTCNAALDETIPLPGDGHSWNHIAATCNSEGFFQLFVNGQLVQEWTDASTVGVYGSQLLSVGKHHDGTTYLPLVGSADDIGLWSRVLTSEEILALYNAPALTPGCTSLEACNYNPEANIEDGSCLYLPETSLASSVGVSSEGLLTVNVPCGLDAWEWNDGSVAASRAIAPFQEYVLTGSVGVAPEVGQVTEEGIVFHVDEGEQWALLASPSSIGSGVEWGCKFVTTGAVGSALGEGASNTAMILEACDDPMAAARVASEYGDGWFLPSMDELGAIYEHVHAAGLGEYFVDNTYNWFWSSTECATDGTAAGDIWFQNGDAFACNNKDSNPGGVIAAKRLDYAQCTYTDTLYVALGATPPVCGPGTVWDEASHSCIVAYPSDTDFDGCVTMTDLLDLLTVFGSCMEAAWACGEPVDYFGHSYATVQIGEQCWFAENLRTETYRTGEAIVEDPDGQGWALSGAAAGAYNQSNATASVHGLLYNGAAVTDPRGVCPTGWSVPSDFDWMDLEIHLGMDPWVAEEIGWRGDPIGDMLKLPEYGGNNESGFSALISGARNEAGQYNHIGSWGVWWSDTPDGDSKLWGRELPAQWAVVQRNSWDATTGVGFSLRCVKD